jgi:hypothetical protein
MNKLNALRKLIREEIVSALREELPRILSEGRSEKTNPEYKNKIREQVRKSVSSEIPLTLNESRKSLPKFQGSDPLSQLLNETAISMTPQDMGEEPETDTGSLGDMFSSARKSTNIEAVEIDTVPDFSGIMDRFKQKGLL